MAKYVLIQFDDDNEADSFTGIIQELPEAHEPANVTVHVVAIFKKPTQFCSCPPDSDFKPSRATYDTDRKSVKGKKWGWWVHKGCGKPRAGNSQTPHNLLDPVDQLARDRTIFLTLIEPRPKRANADKLATRP